MNVLPKIVNKLEQFFDFLFSKEETVLKKFLEYFCRKEILYGYACYGCTLYYLGE